MPYIPQIRRKLFDEQIKQLSHRCPSVGEVNYIITCLLIGQKPKNYAEFNALIGILECCKLELYRRMVATHEDEAIKRNGDVYENLCIL